MQKLNPIRLKEIKIVRGYTSEALARILNITKQSISKYENGIANPSPEIIEKIISRLDIPRSYLTKENIIKNDNMIPLFFRTPKSTRQNEKELARIQVKWAYEIISELNKLEKGEKLSFNIPDFGSDMSIADKAIFLREYWNLGLGPIDNLTDIMENNGIKILTINTEKIKVDAYSQVIESIPFVILNKFKGSAVRWRFNLAHELGHLILHQDIIVEELDNQNSFDEIEKEANLFASNFLLPANSFGNCIISDKLDYFIGLKSEWKVSIAAMIFRCNELNLFNEQKILQLRKQMSTRKWHTIEPLDDVIVNEKPSRITNIIKRNITDKNNAESFLNTIRLAISDLENLCSLERNFFSKLGASYSTNTVANNEYTQLSIF